MCTTTCGDGIKAGQEECDSLDRNICTNECLKSAQSKKFEKTVYGGSISLIILNVISTLI